MLGSFLTFIFLLFIMFLIIAGIVSSVSSDKLVAVSNNSVLYARFDKPISERTSNNPFENINFASMTSKGNMGLNDILDDIKKAKKDNRIKGIYLDLSTIPAGVATIEEIRNSLIDFKSSGKFIYAYSEGYSQGAYYVASVADKIFLNPQGTIDFKGLNAEVMFLKGTLEKLEIEPQIIRHGKFKSAVEPLILDKMSDENRKQVQGYVGAIWNSILSGISKSRNIEVKDLQNIADSLLIQNAEDALKYHLVDQLTYQDQFYSELSEKLGLTGKQEIKTVNISKYTKAYVKDDKKYVSEKIAVIYATGEIGEGKGNDKKIGSITTCEAIRKARLDEKVKAVVLRVNSPGGSALASDVIWREVYLTHKIKPVIVSMGDVAASGGYYISCAADSIVAEPNTITGSIGVFGLLLNAKKFFNDKLGITFDNVKTGNYADLGSIDRPLTASERAIVQKSIEKVYDTFITRVSEGRHISKALVDSIGQGRVWSGVDAKERGLVDILGGIDTAIIIAARMAKIDKYRIIYLPEQKEPLAEFLENLSDDAETSFLKSKVGDTYKYYSQLQSLLKMNGIQARMEYNVEIY